GDDVATVEPLQHDAREDQMGGRGANIDADAEDDDFVLLDERAPGAGEEDAAADLFFSIHPWPSGCSLLLITTRRAAKSTINLCGFRSAVPSSPTGSSLNAVRPGSLVVTHTCTSCGSPNQTIRLRASESMRRSLLANSTDRSMPVISQRRRGISVSLISNCPLNPV